MTNINRVQEERRISEREELKTAESEITWIGDNERFVVSKKN